MTGRKCFIFINLFLSLSAITTFAQTKKTSASKSLEDPCSTWLGLPSQPSSVEVGQLNVTGNQITVEAEINRTAPYASETLEEGDVVSKHDHPGDVNYLLRPNHAYINTDNGFYGTPDVCEVKLNKTYHVAMVYDGASLKFYRNGFLLSQIAATGNLTQNSWPTRIGYYINEAYNSNFSWVYKRS